MNNHPSVLSVNYFDQVQFDSIFLFNTQDTVIQNSIMVMKYKLVHEKKKIYKCIHLPMQ